MVRTCGFLYHASPSASVVLDRNKGCGFSSYAELVTVSSMHSSYILHGLIIIMEFTSHVAYTNAQKQYLTKIPRYGKFVCAQYFVAMDLILPKMSTLWARKAVYLSVKPYDSRYVGISMVTPNNTHSEKTNTDFRGRGFQ